MKHIFQKVYPMFEILIVFHNILKRNDKQNSTYISKMLLLKCGRSKKTIEHDFLKYDKNNIDLC